MSLNKYNSFFRVKLYCYQYLVICFFSTKLLAQDSAGFFSSSAEFNMQKFIAAEGVQVLGYGGSLAFLSAAWYNDYPQSQFHFFNDGNEWLQLDKAGHFVTSYYLGRMGIDMLQWSGVKGTKAIFVGAAGSFLYLTGIEVLDGFSDGWGFSWSDFSANTIGTGLVAAQKYLQLKKYNHRLLKGIAATSFRFSFSPSSYSKYRPSLLGNNLAENILKDYNGQTYWASFNLSSFMKEEARFPKWLNLAFGYGAEGMISGNPGFLYISPAGEKFEFQRYRQYYFSIDVDLSRIKTRYRFLKTIFETFSFLKIPAPALELSRSRLKAHAFFY